jgi:hypothetical protein
METKRIYEEMADMRLLERHCQSDDCEFGCKHDFVALKQMIEQKLHCKFGKVQYQSSTSRRYQCISHIDCPVYIIIAWSTKNNILFSEISGQNHSDTSLGRNGIHIMWLNKIDELHLITLCYWL